MQSVSQYLQRNILAELQRENPQYSYTTILLKLMLVSVIWENS